MKRADIADLLLLAALWGASFLFMRIAVPEFGPVALSCVRVVMASLALLPLLLLKGLWPELRAHWRAIAVVGIVNSALPFMAYNYAALSITAGLSSVFNATSPLWVGLIAWLWLGDRLNAPRTLGLGIGLCGVLWLVWDKAGFHPGVIPGITPGVGGSVGISTHAGAGWAVAACLFATLCYGFGPNLTKRYLTGVPPLVVATGSQVAASMLLALPAWWLWPATAPSARAWWLAAVLGVFCTGLAYLLYFRLVARVGPARTITVTFLIPLFAVLWGWVFLGETVTPVMAGAGAVIVLGTALSTGLIAPRAKKHQAGG